MRTIATTLRLLAALAALMSVTTCFGQPIAIVLGWSEPPTAAPAVTVAGGNGRRAAPGFVVSVESDPSPAVIWVDGKERGHTPAVVNVICDQDQPVKIVVEHADAGRWQRTYPCQQGGSVVVEARFD